jgi:hypothetical protein
VETGDKTHIVVLDPEEDGIGEVSEKGSAATPVELGELERVFGDPVMRRLQFR